MKKWKLNHNGNMIVAESQLNCVRLYVNEKLQDKRVGFLLRHLFGVKLRGQLPTGESIEVFVGAFWNARYRVFRENDIELTNVMPEKRKSRLPIIALIFSFIPALPVLFIILLDFLGVDNGILILLFLLSALLNLPPFSMIGIITAAFALRKGKEQIGKIGFIFSIIAIVWSLVWTVYIIQVFNSVNFIF